MAFPISPIDGQQATVNATVYTYNSTDGAWYRTGTTIGGGGSGTFVTQNYTGTGSQTAFSVTSGVTVSSVIVTENGVVQTPTTDYTVSGTVLTFTTAPASGTAIQIREIAIAAAAGAAGVKITALTYANSAVSANTTGSETIVVSGSGFDSNAKVYIDTTLCTTTYASSSSLTFISPAKSQGSYMLYVYHIDGGTGAYPVGITYVSRTPSSVEYLVVAGGGGGGGWAGGGGGAGGYSTATGYSITPGVTIIITVGAGGAGTTAGTYASGTWSSGENSIFGSVTATGGGAGATFGITPVGTVNGGSGGGASYNTSPGTGTAGQGNAGSSYSAGYAGGGGGGAGAAGSNKDGGAGLSSSITGTAIYYAGGGAASYGTAGLAAGTGGLGGGANGINSGGPAPGGTANTGGGGASAYTPTSSGTSQTGGGNGGSGVVIIRFADIYSAFSNTGSPTITVAGGYRVYKWTTSGSITF